MVSCLCRLCSKEFHQHQSKDFRVHIMSLTFQSAELRKRHRLAQRSRCVIHRCIARAAIHNERRHDDACCPFGGYRTIFT